MQHKKRKKIYSEQLLQIHEDSKKIHPGKEIYATGYVIELKKDCYFAGFQDGKILCRSFEYARYFSNTHSAEQFVKEYLGYAGLRCNLCKVAWGLAVHGLEPGWKENLKPYKNQGQILQFSSYHDGVNYQKENIWNRQPMFCLLWTGKKNFILQRNFLGDKSSPLINRKK